MTHPAPAHPAPPRSIWQSRPLADALMAPMRVVVRRFPRTNPDAPLESHSPRITAAIAQMTADPRPLQRPVAVLSGYRSWWAMAHELRWRLIERTSQRPQDIIAVSYIDLGDIDAAAARALRAIRAAFPPSAVPDGIDLVGISMGGLVARRLASGAVGEPPPVRRIFTLASPHRGALLAERIAPDPAARAMRPGSAFLQSLDAAWPQRRYDLIPYAVLNDTWVGATRSAPPDTLPIWTPGTRILSHFCVSKVPGITADIARRLRTEPLLAAPATPPPHD